MRLLRVAVLDLQDMQEKQMELLVTDNPKLPMVTGDLIPVSIPTIKGTPLEFMGRVTSIEYIPEVR